MTGSSRASGSSETSTPAELGEVPPEVLELARAARRITVLTGAGMSQESGVATFRDADTGLWSHVDPNDFATPDAWFGDKPRVNAWYMWRLHLMSEVEPNAGHRAIAEWAALPGREVRVVTQNIDNLHERAGSTVLSHLHGSLFAWRCDHCHSPAPTPEPPSEPVEEVVPGECQQCGQGDIRPGVVWFQEMLPERPFLDAVDAVQDADLVIVVGTSGIVQPAASLPHLAGARGIPVVEIDPRSTQFTHAATYSWRSTAAAALPAIIAAIRADS